MFLEVFEGTAVAGIGQVGLLELSKQLQAGKLSQRVDIGGRQKLKSLQHAFGQGVDRSTRDIPVMTADISVSSGVLGVLSLLLN